MRAVLFIFSMFIAVWWTSVNLAKLIKGERIPWLNFVFMAAGLTAVITYIMNIW